MFKNRPYSQVFKLLTFSHNFNLVGSSKRVDGPMGQKSGGIRIPGLDCADIDSRRMHFATNTTLVLYVSYYGT